MLNETNFTIGITKLIIESNNSGITDLLESAIPLVALIVSVIITLYTNKLTSNNLEMQLRHQEKGLYIQMNQPEIMKNVKELVDIILSGYKGQITDFLNSANGVYIPKDLRNSIKATLEIMDHDLSEGDVQKLMNLVNEYVT